jgi:hypothetical protein
MLLLHCGTGGWMQAMAGQGMGVAAHDFSHAAWLAAHAVFDKGAPAQLAQ